MVLVTHFPKDAEVTAVEAGEDVAQATFRRERLERQCELLPEGPFDDLTEEAVAGDFERLKHAGKALASCALLRFTKPTRSWLQ